MQLLSVTGYSDLFHEPVPDNTLTFVTNYPTDILLIKLSKINSMLFHQRDDEVIDVKILKEVIFEGIQGFDQIEEFRPYFSKEKRWFAEAPIGLLIMDCLKNFKTIDLKASVNTLELARNLLKTILIYNQFFFGQIGTKNLETPEGIFKLEAMQQGYMRAKGPLKLISVLKFAFVSKFLDVYQPLKQEAIAYLKKMGLGNPWLFGKFFLLILAKARGGTGNIGYVLDVAGLPENLIREFAIDQKKLEAKQTLSFGIDIVSNPFYFVNPHQALILDYSFLQYPLEHGFFFSFYQNGSPQLYYRFKTYSEFKSHIALEFFERYLVGGLLNKIFYRHNQIVISTEKYQDFIVRSTPRDVFIFEVKMNDIHIKTIDQLDYLQFKKFLDDKFLSKKTEDTKNKGIQQIIRQIEYLSETQSELRKMLHINPSVKLNIYPVIICSDHNMNLSGVNDYLNLAFEERTCLLRHSFQSIKPLVVVHVDCLIKFFGPLKTNASLFKELLNGYTKSKKNLEKKYRDNRGAQEYLFAKRSFNSYMEAKKISDPFTSTLDEIAKSFNLEINGFMDGNID